MGFIGGFMKSERYVEVTAWVLDGTRKEFKRRFKGCLSRFIRACMERALQDREFFNDLFFDVADGGGK